MRWLARLAAVLAAGAGLVYVYYVQFRPDPAHFPVQGIDVSHHQNAIDWRQVAQDGVTFAYIKATEGNDYRDRRFLENWTEAKTAGVTRGAYHFYSLCRPASTQAKNFMALVPRDADMLAPVIDLEFGGNCSARPAGDEVKTNLAVFSDAVFAAYDMRPVLYVTNEFLAAYGGVLPANSGLWLRSIAWTPRAPGRSWIFWQYHNRGRVRGIEGPVDRNVFNGSVAEFEALATAATGRRNAGVSR